MSEIKDLLHLFLRSDIPWKRLEEIVRWLGRRFRWLCVTFIAVGNLAAASRYLHVSLVHRRVALVLTGPSLLLSTRDRLKIGRDVVADDSRADR